MNLLLSMICVYTGVMQSNATLKQHVSDLESGLASREAALTELQAALTRAAREHDQLVADNAARLTHLDTSLQRERDSHRDVRKQVTHTTLTHTRHLLDRCTLLG